MTVFTAAPRRMMPGSEKILFGFATELHDLQGVCIVAVEKSHTASPHKRAAGRGGHVEMTPSNSERKRGDR